MRILFWGTPDFAAPALRALSGEGFDVVGVITQPDRPQGRSRSTLVPSPVKEVALAEGMPVLQPERPRTPEFLDAVRALAPDISVVVAYGHILVQEVIDLPRLGTVNIHASLLPRWRGAAPIQAALLAGDAETGITIMRMVPKLDAGPIILQNPIPILEDETYGELQLRLSEHGALALIQALALIEMGTAEQREQDEALVTYAPKIERDDARVSWEWEAARVARAIRAYDPRPGAFTTLGADDLKLFGARVEPERRRETEAVTGTVLGFDLMGMRVACGDDHAVRVVQVQQAGKRRMAAADWARGAGVIPGDRLGG